MQCNPEDAVSAPTSGFKATPQQTDVTRSATSAALLHFSTSTDLKRLASLEKHLLDLEREVLITTLSNLKYRKNLADRVSGAERGSCSCAPTPEAAWPVAGLSQGHDAPLGAFNSARSSPPVPSSGASGGVQPALHSFF